MILFNNLLMVPTINLATYVILDNLYDDDLHLEVVVALITPILLIVSLFTVDIFTADFMYHSRRILKYKDTRLVYVTMVVTIFCSFFQNWFLLEG